MTASMAAEAWQLDATALPAVPRTYVQQNFTSLYAIDTEGSSSNDLAFRLHANGLCVVALAPSHAALSCLEVEASVPAPTASGDQAGAASAAAGDGATAQQTAAGTAASSIPQAAEARLAFNPKLLQAEFRKGRGPLLHADTILGRLMAGGREWVLRCGVRGLLVELNPRLTSLQGLMLLRELKRGYLAILDVRAAEASLLAEHCLSEQAYQQRQQQQTAARSDAGQPVTENERPEWPQRADEPQRAAEGQGSQQPAVQLLQQQPQQ